MWHRRVTLRRGSPSQGGGGDGTRGSLKAEDIPSPFYRGGGYLRGQLAEGRPPAPLLLRTTPLFPVSFYGHNGRAQGGGHTIYVIQPAAVRAQKFFVEVT